jgi:hypothetical protein
MFYDLLEYSSDLDHKLTCVANHDHLGLLYGGIYTEERPDNESSRLSCTVLGLCDEIRMLIILIINCDYLWDCHCLYL